MNCIVKRDGIHRRVQRLKPSILEAFTEILDISQFHQSKQVRAVEQQLSTHLGAFAVTTNSGTSALQVALLAAGIGAGDEVIVPALTFVSTAFTVSAVGATPVFVDIDLDTLCINPDAIRNAITSRTKAIIPVHLYGRMVDMAPIQEIAKAHHLVLIEDAAQAIGAQYRGRYAGTIGDLGCVSLWVGKNLGGLEDGGVVLTRDPHLEPRLRRLINLGRSPSARYLHEDYGIRARMSEVNAAVIRIELDYLTEWIEARRGIASCYNSAFAELPFSKPSWSPERTHVFYKYTILLRSPEERLEFEAALDKAGIESERIYPTLLPDQPAYQNGLPHRTEAIPNARFASDRLTCLPIYPELRADERDHVIATVCDFYGKNKPVSSPRPLENSLKDKSVRLYTELAHKHDASAVARLGWTSRESQRSRFEHFASLGVLKGSSILDVGCGVGDFYAYLLEHGYQGSYRGCDIIPDNCEAATQRFGAPHFAAGDILDLPSDRTFDYVVASGVFSLESDDWETAVQLRLAKMLKLCEEAVIVNFLSAYTKTPKVQGWYYVNPGQVIELCAPLTTSFMIRHDDYAYKKNDFTLILHHDKEDVVSQERRVLVSAENH